MSTRYLTAIFAFLAGLAACRAEWPAPKLTYYHANTEKDALAYAKAEAQRHRWQYTIVNGTGSMRPYINGGEIVLLEPYSGQSFGRGDVLCFNRGDAPRVLHVALDLNKRAVYMSGVSACRSDGWIKRDKILSICRLVITYPRGAKENAVYGLPVKQ